MITVQRGSFAEVDAHLRDMMRSAPPVRTERWQGKDVRNDPAATSYELVNVEISVPLLAHEDLDHWRADIRPNLPWSDDHFLERVGGQPLNPGEQWAKWPWAGSADRFRDAGAKFNHTYMERLWPKFARVTPGGVLPVVKEGEERRYTLTETQRVGIGWRYGDLQSVVEQLVAEPHTRQAWIPLFFPEDTGIADGGRKPCTLGYQFLVRDSRISIWYPLRSCDLVRHYRDDCYLAVRLLLWVLERCRARDTTGFWAGVTPGYYAMHCTSLHIFENDRRTL